MLLHAETTPGVYQASGYGDIAKNESIWSVVGLILMNSVTDTYRFWYFAARKSPETAPLALWFNGGVSLYYERVYLTLING